MNESTNERIVVRGVNWLGDAVMSTPALLRLREAKPAAHIALITSAKLADLWQLHPAVNEVITFTKAEGVGHLSRRLREGRFGTALILPNSFRSAFECWMAGVPQRIGFGGNARGALLTQVVPRRREEIHLQKRSVGEIRRLVQESPNKPRDRFPLSGHQVHDYVHLVKALGAVGSPLPPQIAVSREEVEQFRARHQISGSPVIGLNPGAEYGPAKRWPLERFVDAASHVERAQSCVWVITGGPSDVELCRQISSGIRKSHPPARILELAGQTTLRELCVALASCDVVLTNDTGPMHLAAAVGTAVVVPFGSTSPELTGPSLPGAEGGRLVLGQAPCAPCFLRECPIDFRCMLSISPERIANEVLEQLKK